MLMVPKLLMALVALPNQLVPLTFQMAPVALLNVEVETRKFGESTTLPEIVPPLLLLMVTPPVLVVIGPL